jgi:hypothetical protein
MQTELERLYADAGKEGVYFREFDNAGHYLAAAGLLADLEPLEAALKAAGELDVEAELDVSSLEMGDLVELSAPGVGATREEACRAAWQALKESLAASAARQAELTAVAAEATPEPPRPDVPAGRDLAAVARLFSVRSDFGLSPEERGLALARLERLLAEAGGAGATIATAQAVMEADRQEYLATGAAADRAGFLAWNSLGLATFELELDQRSLPLSLLPKLAPGTAVVEILVEILVRDEPVAPLWQFAADWSQLEGVDAVGAFAVARGLSNRDLDTYMTLLSAQAGARAVDFLRAGRVARTLEVLEGWLYLP